MSLRTLLGLVIVCAGRPASAERAIAVDARGTPFASAELVDALRVRIAPDGAPLQLRVTATARGVLIEGPGGVRDVALGGLRGSAAARLVALAASDLVLGDLAGAPGDTRGAEPRRGEASIGAPRAPVRAAPVALGVLGGVAGWPGVLGALAVDLSLPRDGWLVAFELGGGELVDSAVHVTAAVVRVGAGWQAGPLEARLGITAVPLIVTSGAGDQTVLIGGSASLRARIPVSAAVRGVLAVGADAFATRTEYRLAGMAALATPRVAPWLAAGLEVGL